MSTLTADHSTRKPLYASLTFQLVIGLSAGGITGVLWPDIGASLNPLATGFVKLIKMVAGLIVFLTVITGFTGMKKGAGMGRMGATALIYFEIVSCIALALGMTLANIFQPGKGLVLHADKAVSFSSPASVPPSAVDFLLSVIPKTPVDALASGVMLQVLLVSVLFGYALFALGDRAKPVNDFLGILSEATFKVVGVILKLAPIGVFGAIAFMLGKYGIGSLLPLIKLVGLVYLGCFIIIIINYNIIALLTRFSFIKLLKNIKEEIIISFTTTSSEAALPGLIKKLEQAGCRKNAVGFVIPLGYSFNLDGSSIYLTMGALFLAQAAGVDMTFTQQAGLLLVFLLTSKGSQG
jgi:aerobic C4-dicarboxylate transport protein